MNVWEPVNGICDSVRDRDRYMSTFVSGWGEEEEIDESSRGESFLRFASEASLSKDRS